MSIVEKEIKRIIEGMGLDYIIETMPRANQVLDRYRRRPDKRVRADDGHSLPVGIYIQPERGTLNIAERGNVTDAPSCLIAFADEMPFDFRGEQAQEVAERMKDLAEEFIRIVNESDELKPIVGNIGYSISYDSMDANLCVVTITAVIEEAWGRCI